MLVTDASKHASEEELLDHPWVRVAKGPADAADCILSDPAERVLNAHASQLSIGETEDDKSERPTMDPTEDARASKRARTWVPDMAWNVWGETVSMVARNEQQANRADLPPIGSMHPSDT